MKFDLFEIIVIICIFQLLVFTFFLFTQKPYKISNIFLGIFLFSEALVAVDYLYFSNFTFFSQNYPHLFYIGLPFGYLWGPAIYLFVKSIVSERRTKFVSKNTRHLIPFIACVIFMFIIFYQHNAVEKRILLTSSFFKNSTMVIQILGLFQILLYNIKSLLVLKSYRIKLKDNYSSLSKINLSWLYIVIIGYSISYLISASVQLSGYIFGFYYPLMNKGLFIIFFIFFNIIFFKAWRQPQIFTTIEEDIKYKSSKLTKEEADEWIRKLNEYVTINKPYLKSELSINQLADDLNISARILSQIINEYFHQNFYDYINSLRIEESKRMLVDPSSCKKTVLEILYDVGYNTKSSYNIAFKKATGFTPTEYRKKFLKEIISSEQ